MKNYCEIFSNIEQAVDHVTRLWIQLDDLIAKRMTLKIEGKELV